MNNTASASAIFKSNGSGGTNESQFSIGVSNGQERLSIFGNNNSSLMTIASTGNVGIGTTDPGAKLHIVSETTDMLKMARFNNGTAGAAIILTKARGTSSAPL